MRAEPIHIPEAFLERRSSPRYPASDEPARIAWWEERFRVGKSSACLIDITDRGACLVSRRPAEPGELLWLGLISLPCEWVKATVRSATREWSQWRYHLAFCEPCAAGLIERATSPPRGEPDETGLDLLQDDEGGIWSPSPFL